jgi:hypothetical protein
MANNYPAFSHQQFHVAIAEGKSGIEPNTLETYQAIYAVCFCRREQREKSSLYLQGLMQPLPNKSIETMMLHNQGDDPNSIRAMQHFISQGAWSDEAVLARHAAEVDKDLGDEAGVLIVDGSDFPKQGEESVGVKRQWCGELGKVANCQAGVYLGMLANMVTPCWMGVCTCRESGWKMKPTPQDVNNVVCRLLCPLKRNRNWPQIWS